MLHYNYLHKSYEYDYHLKTILRDTFINDMAFTECYKYLDLQNFITGWK